MSKRKKVDWFNVVVIVALAALLVCIFVVLGRSPMAWVIPSASAQTPPAWNEAVLTWVNPTKNVDGSTITALTGNRAEWSRCAGTAPNYTFGTTDVGQQVWTTPRTTFTRTGLTAGVWCFRVYASTASGESASRAAAS
jgi:hypothetical protein